MTSLQRRVSNCNSIPSDIQPRGNEKKNVKRVKIQNKYAAAVLFANCFLL